MLVNLSKKFLGIFSHLLDIIVAPSLDSLGFLTLKSLINIKPCILRNLFG